MRKKTWYPTIIGGRIFWLENNALKFPAIAPDFNFSAAEITNHLNDIDWTIWGYKIVMNSEARYHQMVSIKEEINDGDDAQDVVVSSHVNIPAPTSVIKQGAERRIKERMKQIKDFKAKYTEDIGQALKIIGADDDFDPNTLTAVIRSITVLDDKILISFLKKHTDGIALYCKRAEGAYEKLGQYTYIPAEDSRKNLTAEPEERIYKIKYIYKDKEVGHFSTAWTIITDIH